MSLGVGVLPMAVVVMVNGDGDGLSERYGWVSWPGKSMSLDVETRLWGPSNPYSIPSDSLGLREAADAKTSVHHIAPQMPRNAASLHLHKVPKLPTYVFSEICRGLG